MKSKIKNSTSKSLSSEKQITAIFPGSFDPITLGHIDVIERLSRTFYKVIVLVADSASKAQLFLSSERVELAKECLNHLPNVAVESNSGLTVKFARKYAPSVLVRSLRGTSDFDYERNIAEANRLLDDSIDTYFIFGRPEFTGIASSIVKEIAKNNGNLEKFVTKNVDKAIKRKIK